MITDARFIPGTQGVYALSGAGTLSRFHYTPNPFSAPPSWQDTDLPALFTRIRAANAQGQVYVRGGSDNQAVSQSFLSGDGRGSWIEVAFNPLSSGCIATTIGTYNSGADRFEGVYCSDAVGKIQRIVFNLGGSTTVNSVEVDVNYDAPRTVVDPFIPVALYYDGSLMGSISAHSPASGSTTLTFSTPTSGVGEIEITSSAFTNPGDGHTYITGIRINYDAPLSDVTIYSSDYGFSFGSLELIGGHSDLSTGIDVQKIGSTALAGATGSLVFKATNGGGWSLYSGTLPTGAAPTAIVIPHWNFGGTSTPNSGSSPQYLLGSGSLSSGGESLWKVTGNGSVFTAISPRFDGSLSGVIVSPDALNMPWNSGSTILAIARFNEGVKFCVSVNTGATWHFTSLEDNAVAIATRRQDIQTKQAIIANGSLGGYIPNYQLGTVVNNDKHSPASLFSSIDVYG